MEGYWVYFSNGVLNSDGRRLFETIARMIVYEKPWYKGLVNRVRHDPCLENVLRLAEEILGEEAYEIIEAVIEGPYRWRYG